MSKPLERRAHNQLYVYLTEFKLLLDEQSGFRETWSGETVLLKLSDYVLSNIAQCDLFGMIVRNRDLYCCRGNELAWFRSYLANVTNA